ncbi:hypothetical protein OAO94_04585 [Flavobacteriaceae bacterium]|jgi:hypothetical protein|nr:hypothetical protein [Flavobacteriaceae bacterium]MDC0623056.1 hypothetical protein [Flavobacteriaceae bacterium]|tara:strand:+ start:566 stop:976 length:411 start_codon:yes stop_codon:yes gene_type:complete
MIFKVFRYISFLVNSSNQHSVHSPTVYKLLTECIYKIDKKLVKRDLISLQNSIMNIYQDEFQVDYIDNILLVNISEFVIKKDKIVLINNIRNNNQYNFWKKLIRSNKIQVSIDFYYFGIIIVKNKKLQKQDYQIRL